MFSKGNKSSKSRETSRDTPSAPRAGTTPSAVPSIISRDVKIHGDLVSEGDVQIDGTVDGDVKSRSLTIGEDAVVTGTLTAGTAKIYGTVRGEIRADSVVLAETARVDGDIGHRLLTMEAGAEVNGRLTRLDKAVDPVSAKVADGTSSGS